MLTRKAPVVKLRTYLFVVLIVQKITEICSKPAIGTGRAGRKEAPFPYWKNEIPTNYYKLDKNPFDASDEDTRFLDTFVSSEEDDFEYPEPPEPNSEEKKGTGRGDRRYGHGPPSHGPPHHGHGPPHHGPPPPFRPYGYDPAIEQASVPQLQSMLDALNKDVYPHLQVPSFHLTPLGPIIGHMMRKMYCYFFTTHSTCSRAPDDLFIDDPWYEGFRSKKT